MKRRIRAAASRARRRLAGSYVQRAEQLEAKVAKQKALIAHLREQREAAEASASWVDGPRFKLDYDGAEIEVVAAARQRTARAQLKEPFTVAWIESSLQDGDVLYDIGANIGSYSLIAATVCPGARVVAVEPGFLNFAVLCSNLAINDFGGRVTPIPLALGETTSNATLRYWTLVPGAGTHEAASRSGEGAVFEQPALSFALDDLIRIFELPPPTHIKLDVDGLEAAVLAGAQETLATPALRSLMVELPVGAADDPVAAELERHGFRLAETHDRRSGSGVSYGRFDRGT